MKNLPRLLAGLKVSVKTNPTLVRGTVVLDIHPDDIPPKDKTLAKDCLLNSMKLTGKDDMDMGDSEKLTAILFKVISLHEMVRKMEGLPLLGLYGSGKGKDKGNGNGGD
ncbi:hypothetical protein FCV25MIE_29961 [Fagus crenata]